MKWYTLGSCFFVIFLASCGVKKYIPEGKILYAEAEVEFKSNEQKSDRKVEKELENILRPKPNKTVLGFRPGLRNYYRAKGKKSNFINRFLNKRFGENPVYLKDAAPDRNVKLITKYLESKGYFNSETHFYIDTTTVLGKVNYKVEAETPYILSTYQFEGEPNSLGQLIEKSLTGSLLKPGKNYDLDILVEERERIVRILLEEGYFHFTPDLLIYSMDTAAYADKRFDLYLRINEKAPEEALAPYKISEIYIYPNHSIQATHLGHTDTLVLPSYTLVGSNDNFRPEAFDPYILFEKGDVYKKSLSDKSRQRLFGIGAFGFVNVRHQTGNNSLDSLGFASIETHIHLSPLTRYSLRSELQAISKSNNFMGPLFTTELKNRNALKGGELLNVGIRLGYETQIAGGRQTGLSAFEGGIYGELVFPRIIGPIQWNDRITFGIPRTKINLSLSVLDRVGFYRLNSAVFGFGYNWSSSRYAFHEIKPVSITYSNLARSSEPFQEILQKNTFLQRSFEQQFIPGFEYSFTFNELWNKNKKNHFFFHFHSDVAGNVLGLIQKGLNASSEGFIFGNEYARYLRFDLDIRYYISIGKDSRLIFRTFSGLGIPMGNSLSLPYIKQYFSGGPNSVRAFRIRSLGPGTYRPDVLDAGSFFDQAGDIRLETNIEYRFPIMGYVKGAVFMDAGNVWLFNDNPALPGASITRSWYRQLALGSGIGFRFDFDFFVVRIDLATPLRKPWLEKGSRWISEFRPGSKEWRRENLVWNLAIGYPF